MSNYWRVKEGNMFTRETGQVLEAGAIFQPTATEHATRGDALEACEKEVPRDTLKARRASSSTTKAPKVKQDDPPDRLAHPERSVNDETA